MDSKNDVNFTVSEKNELIAKLRVVMFCVDNLNNILTDVLSSLYNNTNPNIGRKNNKEKVATIKSKLKKNKLLSIKGAI